MRKALLGAVVVAGVVMAAASAAPERADLLVPRAGVTQSVAAGGEMTVVSTIVGDRFQQLTVIDPKTKAISVYQVELGSGNVRLCCVRNIHWDLQLMHYNGDAPLPREIQSLLEPK